jgi:Uma2 family endonuclease
MVFGSGIGYLEHRFAQPDRRDESAGTLPRYFRRAASETRRRAFPDRPTCYSAPMNAELRPRHRLTVDDFDALIASGRLADARVELIDGDLVDMNAQGPAHASLTVWLRRLLEAAYGSGFHVRDHSPLRATTHDQPEPDLALVRGAPQKRAPHPTGGDVVLVMEVSVRSVPQDRAKAAVYARGGVPEYWLVDPEGEQVEVHRGPQADGSYRSKQTYGPGETIPWPERDDAVDASELLP